MKDQTDILNSAVADCRQIAGARLAIMIKMGNHIQAMIRVTKKYRPSDDDGLCRQDAIALLRDHVLKEAERLRFDVPASNAYWYGAIRMVETYSEKDLALMVEKNVPWSEMNALLAKSDQGKALIGKLKAGKIDTIRVRRAAAPESAPARASAARECGIIEISIMGDETAEQWEDIVASVLSAAVRCEQNPVELTSAALRRLGV
jgi:hypothetical protein